MLRDVSEYKHFEEMQERSVVSIYGCSIFWIGAQSRHVEKLSLNDLYDRRYRGPPTPLF